MAPRLTLRAFAKINLHLRIGQRDAVSGYHALETLFQTVDLSDVLQFDQSDEIRLVGELADTPDGESNLIVKAARALQESTGANPGAIIRLQKTIPMQAGLAGGSTDAAATLWGLNHLWGTGLSGTELRQIGARIGADVPFLVGGGSAIACGRGDRLDFFEPAPRDWWIVLVCSEDGVSTRDAFEALDASEKRRDLTMTSAPSPELLSIRDAWQRGEVPLSTVNSFEHGICVLRPRLRDLLARLTAAGAMLAHLSGTGPTVYGLFRTEREARAAVEEILPQMGEKLLLAKTVGQSPLECPSDAANLD